MNFLQMFLMWFPPCAMFVALAWVTEFAWREEKRAVSASIIRRIVEPDTRPLQYMPVDYPWQHGDWWKL